MAISDHFSLVHILWSCTNRTVCGWVEKPCAQNIDACPRCGCRDVEIVHPPAAEAAWRLGGWEAVWEIHATRLREIVMREIAVHVRK